MSPTVFGFLVMVKVELGKDNIYLISVGYFFKKIYIVLNYWINSSRILKMRTHSSLVSMSAVKVLCNYAGGNTAGAQKVSLA